MNVQLPLNLCLEEETTFSNFYPGPNQQLLTFIKQQLQTITAPKTNSDALLPSKYIYIYGASGFGKSHLLQACCHFMDIQQKTAAYIPFKNLQLLSPPILENLEKLALVCLDDIEQIVGKPEWEEALFHCYNHIQNSSCLLVISASLPPKNLGLQLPDLVSRLSACVIFQIYPLTDQEKIHMLSLRAKQRGIELSDEVCNYLLNHCPRDLGSLVNLLDKLDKASLSVQKKITVPLLKAIID